MKKILLYAIFHTMTLVLLNAQATIHIEYQQILQVNPNLPPVQDTGQLQVLHGKSSYTFDQREKEGADKMIGSDGNTYFSDYSDAYGQVILCDLATGENQVRQFMKGIPFAVQDQWPTIEWQIKPETKMIGSFACQKAIGSFRGRRYMVWFTPEIPLPIGPWKLGGLPGAILEARDVSEQVQFLFTRYELDKEAGSTELTLPPTDESAPSLQAFFAEAHARDEARARMIEASSGGDVKITIYRAPPGQRPTIEQIYEWEQ